MGAALTLHFKLLRYLSEAASRPSPPKQTTHSRCSPSKKPSLVTASSAPLPVDAAPAIHFLHGDVWKRSAEATEYGRGRSASRADLSFSVKTLPDPIRNKGPTAAAASAMVPLVCALKLECVPCPAAEGRPSRPLPAAGVMECALSQCQRPCSAPAQCQHATHCREYDAYITRLHPGWADSIAYSQCGTPQRSPGSNHAPMHHPPLHQAAGATHTISPTHRPMHVLQQAPKKEGQIEGDVV